MKLLIETKIDINYYFRLIMMRPYELKNFFLKIEVARLRWANKLQVKIISCDTNAIYRQNRETNPAFSHSVAMCARS